MLQAENRELKARLACCADKRDDGKVDPALIDDVLVAADRQPVISCADFEGASPARQTSPDDIRTWTLQSQRDWVELARQNSHDSRIKEVETVVASAREAGVWSPFFGYIHPSEIEVRGANYRETLTARGFNPRQRVVLDRILDHSAGHDIYNVKIYAHEALTNVAMALAGRYPKFLGSEYATSVEAIDDLYPIPCIDITQSSLPSAVFDFVVSNEVLEHVPDLDAALRETARLLRPGGVMIGTCPFDPSRVETDIRAVLDGAQIRYVAEPEYHGNPADPEGGSLVFQIPGWDLIDRAKAAGFSNPRMLYRSSVTRGYTEMNTPGVLMFEFFR